MEKSTINDMATGNMTLYLSALCVMSIWIKGTDANAIVTMPNITVTFCNLSEAFFLIRLSETGKRIIRRHDRRYDNL